MASHTVSVAKKSDVQAGAGASKAHVRKDYAAEGIVVHWDSSRCIHSANCLQGLPDVFDVRRRPWVRVDKADADQIAKVVDTCPSRALTYTRLDGAEPGPNGLTEAPSAPATTPDDDGVPVVIALKPDGPLTVEGPVRIELARGEVIEVTDRAFLCRCGGSSNKPFCDGTHKRIDFHAPGW
jgi:uncharacterized Fe-S cluster protein YjdI